MAESMNWGRRDTVAAKVSGRVEAPGKAWAGGLSAVTLTAALGAVWIAGGAAAAEGGKVNAVVGEQVKSVEAAQSAQKRINQLDEETTKMLADYRQMIAETSSLKGYNDQLAVQVQSQDTEIKEMTQQLTVVETTSKEVLPMMQRMLTTLAQFVKLDLPFLPDERAGRIAALQDMMGRADVSISEKYRRLVEAYQIEMEYGRTLEAYEGKVGDRTVDFLRAGRVALMYQTLDGKESGYWDTDAKQWKVDNGYDSAVRAGLKIARKQAAPDFVTVAVHAPKEISR
ncbi:MAG TPA: DUF3450 domain-containing protein [Steroidobacteraceae bacterium]|jgi:hypothetical protein